MRLIDTEKAWENAQRIYTDPVLLHVIKNVLDSTDTVEAVVFPCKPLDTVYFIECHTDGNHKIRSGFALSVEYFACYKPLVTIRYNDNTLESTKHYLGLKAFMTREEAEAALAKMKGGDENGNL